MNRNRTINALIALALVHSAASAAVNSNPDRDEQIKVKSGKWMEQRQRADALVKAGKYEDAEAIYKKVIEERTALDMDLLSEYESLGDIYMKSGKKEQALQTYRDMVTNREKLGENWQLVYPLQQLADCLQKVGKYDEAKKTLARATALQKDSDTIPKFSKITAAVGSPERVAEGEKMRLLGEKWMNLDRQEKAKAYFDRAVALNPKDAMALCDRGEAEHFFEQFTKARADLDNAIKLKPDLAKAYALRARLRENFKEYKQALADFDKAIAIDPKDTDTIGDRAKLADSIGQHKEAVDGYTKVMDINPSLYWPYIQRSVAYGSMGQHK